MRLISVTRHRPHFKAYYVMFFFNSLTYSIYSVSWSTDSSKVHFLFTSDIGRSRDSNSSLILPSIKDRVCWSTPLSALWHSCNSTARYWNRSSRFFHQPQI